MEFQKELDERNRLVEAIKSLNSLGDNPEIFKERNKLIQTLQGQLVASELALASAAEPVASAAPDGLAKDPQRLSPHDRVFDSIDRNHDGVLSRSEWDATMAETNRAAPAAAQVTSPTVSPSQTVKPQRSLVAKLALASATARVASAASDGLAKDPQRLSPHDRVFDLIDRNHDGVLSRSEWEATMAETNRAAPAAAQVTSPTVSPSQTDFGSPRLAVGNVDYSRCNGNVTLASELSPAYALSLPVRERRKETDAASVGVPSVRRRLLAAFACEADHADSLQRRPFGEVLDTTHLCRRPSDASEEVQSLRNRLNAAEAELRIKDVELDTLRHACPDGQHTVDCRILLEWLNRLVGEVSQCEERCNIGWEERRRIEAELRDREHCVSELEYRFGKAVANSGTSSWRSKAAALEDELKLKSELVMRLQQRERWFEQQLRRQVEANSSPLQSLMNEVEQLCRIAPLSTQDWGKGIAPNTGVLIAAPYTGYPIQPSSVEGPALLPNHLQVQPLQQQQQQQQQQHTCVRAYVEQKLRSFQADRKSSAGEAMEGSDVLDQMD